MRNLFYNFKLFMGVSCRLQSLNLLNVGLVFLKDHFVIVIWLVNFQLHLPVFADASHQASVKLLDEGTLFGQASVVKPIIELDL